MPDYGDVNPETGQTSARTEFEGTLDPNAPSVSNGMISPQQWAEYQRRRRRNAILGILGTIGGASALGGLGSLFSGGGAAAGGAAGGALPPIAGGAPWALTPFVAPVAASGTGAAGAGLAGAAAGGVGSAVGRGAGQAAGNVAGTAADGAMGGMSPQDWLALVTSLTGTVGGALSNPTQTEPTTATTDPALREMLDLMSSRIRRSEPLHNSILSMANGLLPTQYQNGGQGRG